jgi:hypothetical protein
MTVQTTSAPRTAFALAQAASFASPAPRATLAGSRPRTRIAVTGRTAFVAGVRSRGGSI